MKKDPTPKTITMNIQHWDQGEDPIKLPAIQTGYIQMIQGKIKSKTGT